MFDFNASLGSALSTITALKAKIPNPTSASNSDFLYASTKLLLIACKSALTVEGKIFSKPSNISRLIFSVLLLVKVAFLMNPNSSLVFHSY